MFFCFLTLPRQEVCHHYVQSEPSVFPKPHANGGNKAHLPHLRKINHQFDKVHQEICDRLWDNQPRTLRKSVTDFGEICHGCWENLPRMLRNQPQTLEKSVADFGKIRHRFWGNPSLFGEIRHRLWEKIFWGNPSPILGK